MKIISGGQSGVDRAALDAALAAGLTIGGWCPRGRQAEDGVIADLYPLVETASADPAERTAANIVEADATLIIVADLDPAKWGPGTRLAREIVIGRDRPYFIICLAGGGASFDVALASVRAFLRVAHPAALNIAGPRESEAPGIYARARDFLARLFAGIPGSGP